VSARWINQIIENNVPEELEHLVENGNNGYEAAVL
jgi:hypothetical protein